MKAATLDIECYKDYFEAVFKCTDTGNVKVFELYEDHPLDVAPIRSLLSKRTIITFNGTNYDLPLLSMALEGADNQALKDASDDIIQNNLMPWQFENKYDVGVRRPDHIDIQNVLFGQSSLKLYGARIGFRKLQDLPIEPGASISPEQRELLTKYCINDNEVTKALYDEISQEIELRRHLSKQYGVDLRSKSDAQIAEAVIKSEYQKLTGKLLRKPAAKPSYPYEPPFYLHFQTTELQKLFDDICDARFHVKPNGKIIEPDCLKGRRVTVGDTSYKLGIGGIHAVNKREAYQNVTTIDVASYYPNMVLQCGFAPAHMGQGFLDVYRGIVEQRLKAKREGDKVTADTLKITANGTFGKMGSPHSTLYAPNMMIQVTVTGQLTLLMLIEQLELAGIRVISANTDGIEALVPDDKRATMRLIVSEWEHDTGLVMEYEQYRSIHYRDVNNYVAITTDGKVKTKGAFALGGMAKNPNANVCIEAVIAQIRDDIPIEQTIMACNDVAQFLVVRTVKGGAVWREELLGKAIRWYYSKDGDTIHYVTNGNKVPKSDDARPMMDLADSIPADLDYQRYINEADKLLDDIAYAEFQHEYLQ